MKQLAINFEKRRNQKVTPERIKKVCELVNAGATPREAVAVVRLGASCAGLLTQAGIIKKVGKNQWKAVEKLHQSTFDEFIRLKKQMTWEYNNRVLHEKQTDMLGLVKLPKSAPVKKAVALPWWKRFLLYLANH